MLVGEATQARHRGRDRLRGRRRARAEGQGGAGPALARAAGRRAPRRRGPVERARGAVRRPRPRVPARQGPVPRDRATSGGRSLVSVVGVAGIGKSRLAWEFEKYVDGLVETSGGTAAAASPTATASRTGRSPRWCACAPGSPRTSSPSDALAKLRTTVERARARRRGARLGRAAPRSICSASTDRVAPRPRGPLLGLAAVLRADGRAAARWCCVFEDIHWADAALLDFIEYLLDWSREPPDLRRSRSRGRSSPSGTRAGDARRAASTRADARAARRRGDGRAPARARPRPARGARARRSATAPTASRSTPSRRCGCCSTAACSSRDGDGYRVSRRRRGARGPGDAARADRRAARRARAGRSGTLLAGRCRCSARRSPRAGSPRSPGLDEAEVEPLLASLVRKELLTLADRPALAGARPVRLPPGARPARRLRDARAPRPQGAAPRGGRATSSARRGIDPDEIAEVIAAHYVDAHAADPEADDADDVKAQARDWLHRAGERAAALAAPEDARPRIRSRRRAGRGRRGLRAAARARRRDGAGCERPGSRRGDAA